MIYWIIGPTLIPEDKYSENLSQQRSQSIDFMKNYLHGYKDG